MNRIQRQRISIALCLLGISGALAQAGQRDGRLLQKSADAVFASSTKASQANLTIRLNGLRASDLINIRPAGSQVSATAGTLSKTARLQGVIVSEPIGPGQSLDESALSVTPNVVTFMRTSLTTDMVFLDIEAPARARIRVIADGKTILRATIKHPISLHNQEWFTGSSNLSGTISRAGLALAGFGGALQHLREGDYRGVSFSELQVLEKHSPKNGSAGEAVMAALQIDEAGHVVDVIPLTDVPPGFEQTLRTWRFAPYLVSGRATSVSTVVKIVFQ